MRRDRIKLLKRATCLRLSKDTPDAVKSLTHLRRCRKADCFSRFIISRSRVLISNFLQANDASELTEWLSLSAPWEPLAEGQGDRQGLVAPANRLDSVTRPILSYAYDSVFLFGAASPSTIENSYEQRLASFIASSQFVAFVKAVTQLEQLVRADGHASRYRAGDYLDLHTDFTRENEPRGVRRIAFVLGMTERWNPNWGGWTIFPDRSLQSLAVSPGYNQLLLFSVPQPHLVTRVAPSCPASRYAISGWVRSTN